MIALVAATGACADPPPPPPSPPPRDLPQWSTAPHVQWTGLRAPITRPLAVFVGDKGGALDQIVADVEVTTFLNDRFHPFFLAPEAAQGLPSGAWFVDANGCALLQPFTPASAADWIDAANQVLVALHEGTAAPAPLEAAISRWTVTVPPHHPLRRACKKTSLPPSAP